MDTFIAGIVIVVELGILVAPVRHASGKPRPRKHALSEADFVDAAIAGDSLHRTFADFLGEDPIDIDIDVGH